MDLSGQVIGIPTLAAVDPEMGAEAPGIGFAIDSSTVRQVANSLALPVRATNLPAGSRAS